MRCPVCYQPSTREKMPCCTACWTNHVPVHVKRRLARLRFGTDAYRDGLEAALLIARTSYLRAQLVVLASV